MVGLRRHLPDARGYGLVLTLLGKVVACRDPDCEPQLLNGHSKSDLGRPKALAFTGRPLYFCEKVVKRLCFGCILRCIFPVVQAYEAGDSDIGGGATSPLCWSGDLSGVRSDEAAVVIRMFLVSLADSILAACDERRREDCETLNYASTTLPPSARSLTAVCGSHLPVGYPHCEDGRVVIAYGDQSCDSHSLSFSTWVHDVLTTFQP